MKKYIKGKKGLYVGLLCTSLVAALMSLNLYPFEALEGELYDYRFRVRGAIKPPDDVVIAAIDEKSIKKIGRWPWPRKKMATILKKLHESEAAIVAFDVIFSETEEDDKVFEEAIWDAGNVILPMAVDFERENTLKEEEYLTRSSFQKILNKKNLKNSSIIWAKDVMLPVPSLAKGTLALGNINFIPDQDGIVRKETTVIEYNGRYYPSFPIQILRYYLGIPSDSFQLVPSKGILLGNKRFIPTDQRGRTIIHYYGPIWTFKYISISDIIDGTIEPAFLKGKIILIGGTALTLYDLIMTPFPSIRKEGKGSNKNIITSPIMTGVEKHANVISSILEERYIVPLPFEINMFILILSGIVLSLLITQYRAIGATIITTSALALIILSGYFLFSLKGIWINLTYTSLNIIFVSLSVMSYKYLIEDRYSRMVKALFSNYSTEKIVDALIENPNLTHLGGEKREITVLFSDIVGFTSFSEIHSPEEVVNILNEYLGKMTDVVLRWDGTIDKFIGDAIVAFWNAPVKQKNHAELAVRCALNMLNNLEELQKKWQSEGKTVLDIGIGINTGEVIVGNIGAEGKKMDYTVIGDHVNLCARIETLTRKYKAHIIITEFTMKKIKDLVSKDSFGHLHIQKAEEVAIKEIEKVRVRGKKRPVLIYELTPQKHNQ